METNKQTAPKTKLTAAELNALLASFKGLQMSAPFRARFAGNDAITGASYPAGIFVRMLDGKALLVQPYCGGAGVEVLSFASGIPHGRFVDDIDGDGTYYGVNRRGEAVEFVVAGDRVEAKVNYGWKCSVAAFRAQKLRHCVALVRRGGE